MKEETGICLTPFSLIIVIRFSFLGYWFWVDDESGHEWEYAADSWDEMFAIKIDQIGMTLREAMEKTPPEKLEIE